MLKDRQSLADEIERLEKELDSQHFRALFDRKVEHKKQKHLKKLRKELAELDGTAVVSQPVRRAEPKPAPKAKAPKTPPPAKPAVARKPFAKPAVAKKPAAKTTRTAPQKPAAPPPKARKRSK